MPTISAQTSAINRPNCEAPETGLPWVRSEAGTTGMDFMLGPSQALRHVRRTAPRALPSGQMNTAMDRMTRDPHADPQPRLFILVPTHTTRHLEMCLASLAWQSAPCDGVIVSCDTDDPAIADELRRIAPTVWACAARRGIEHGLLWHVSRPHQGEARLNQVRNNGLRALDRFVSLNDRDLVIVLDGDTLLHPAAIEGYRRLASSPAEIVIPFRINVDQPRTAMLDTREILSAASRECLPGVLAEIQGYYRESLVHRQERYERQIASRRLWRWLGLASMVKSHKPKILGGHHAVRVGALRLVNAYDEAYVGYGYDDDDLSRRLYQARPEISIAIAVTTIGAFHLWHPSRAPARPTDSPGYQRFCRPDLPSCAEHGWRSPLPQPEPVVFQVQDAARREA
jgi:Glycosyltransferase like family 2